MTRGKWIAAGIISVLLLLICVLRFWGTPAIRDKIIREMKSGPPSSSVTRLAVWLFDNPIVADSETRLFVLLVHTLALDQERKKEECLTYAEKLLEFTDSSPQSVQWSSIALSVIVNNSVQNGKPAQAQAALKRWIQRMEETCGKDHPRLVRPFSLVLNCLVFNPLTKDEAKKLAEKVIAIILKHGGPNDPALRQPLEALRNIALLEMNWDEAIRAAEQLKQLDMRLAGSNSDLTELRYLKELLFLTEKKGDDAKALELYAQVVDKAINLARSGSIEVNEALTSTKQAALLASKFGQHDQAAAWLQNAMGLPGFDERVSPAIRADCYLTLAEELSETARFSQMRESLARAVALGKTLPGAERDDLSKRLEAFESNLRQNGCSQLADEVRSLAVSAHEHSQSDVQTTQANAQVSR